MIDLVIFKLGPSPNDPVGWASFEGATIGEAGRVSNVAALSTIKDRFPDETRTVAILQGEQVAMRAIAAPPKQASKLRAAAAYLLEDELAEPIDNLHIVVTNAPPRAALAVSKAVFKDFLAAFDEAGISLAEITVDYACIGASEAACIIVGDRGRIVASRGSAGFAAELALAEAIAPSFIEAAGDAAVVAYGAYDPVGRWANVPVERRPLPHEADLLSLYGAQLSTKGAFVNFLSGEFRRKVQRAFKLGPWRRPAALAAGLAAAAIVTAAAAGLRDGKIASQYEDSARAMHAASFPTYAGGDIGSHAREILSAGVKSASFLEMTGRLTRAVESQEGIAIDRIRYDASQGEFAFSIRSQSDAGIEAFRAALGAQGLVAADSGGYRRSGDAWIGEMTASVK